MAVRGDVSGVWHHADDSEMAFFYVLNPDFDGNGFARAAAAGRGELAGICRWTDVFCDCATGQRIRGDFLRESPASAIAGIRGRHSGWNSWRGLRKLFAVGHGGRIQIGALAVVYGGPLIVAQWPIFSGIVG